MTDRSLVKQYADSIKRSRERFVENLHTPYPDFKHEELQLLIDKMTVSYKPDQPNPSILKKRNQTAGGLLEETAYHYLGQDKENPKYGIFCTRKNIADITPDKIDDIRDESGHLKKRLYALLERCDRDEKAFTAKLSNWSKTHNVKKVKLLLKANPATMIPVRDKKGRIYKYYASGENLFADIYNPVKPGSPPKWEMEIVSSYRAHQDGFLPDWKRQYPWAKLIMRLYKNDIVAFTDSEGNRELRRVRKMSSGVLFLRELKIAKKPKGKEGIGEQFTASQLQDKNACKAGVDAIGRYFDPKGKTYAGDRA
jgi:CRISPR-associated endonuclease Csn1